MVCPFDLNRNNEKPHLGAGEKPNLLYRYRRKETGIITVFSVHQINILTY